MRIIKKEGKIIMAQVKIKKFVNNETMRSAYVVARIPDAERAFRASMGFKVDDLKKIEGKFLLLKGYQGRIYILEDNFEKGFEAFEHGSFNAVALLDIVNYLKDDCKNYFCTACGKFFDNANNHDCNAVYCERCGERLTSQEVKFGRCKNCALEYASRLYGYHRRPNREDVVFERPHLRDSYCHLGIELEVDRNGRFTDSQRKKLAEAINPDIFNPVCMFEEDCSIGGLEAIFQPLTYKGINNLYDHFNKFYKTALDEGGIFRDKNGLHFHIDLQYFGERGTEERGKGLAMLIYIVNIFFDFWATISHRRHDGFHYTRKKDEVRGITTAIASIRNASHYDALNAERVNTAEVRFFGGYIDCVEDLTASADIVNALARWAKTASLGQVDKATPASIVRYINDPANVLRFVEYATPNGYHNANGDALKSDFIKALKDKIN